MAVQYWTGTVDGDFQNNGNWTEAASPVAGDEIVFDGRSVVDLDEGTLPSETGNIAFDLIHVKSSYAGAIGTVGEPLAIGTAAGSEITVVFEGTGSMHLMCSLNTDNAASDAVIPRVICNSVGGTLYLYSLSNDGANTSTFTDVYLTHGTLELDLELHTGIVGDGTGPVITNLYIAPRNNKLKHATCTASINSYKVNGPTYTNLYMQNGTFTTDSGLGTLHLRNGTLNLGTDAGAGTNVDIVTELIQTGGTLNWNPNEDAAYIAEGHIFGGSLNCSDTVNETNSRVLGSGANKNIYLYNGASMDLQIAGSGLVTVAASSALINLGGIITTDSLVSLGLTYSPDLGS